MEYTLKLTPLNGGTTQEIKVPITGFVETDTCGIVPLVDFKWMSDEEWIKITNTCENKKRLKKYNIVAKE